MQKAIVSNECGYKDLRRYWRKCSYYEQYTSVVVGGRKSSVVQQDWYGSVSRGSSVNVIVVAVGRTVRVAVDKEESFVWKKEGVSKVVN